MKFKQHLVRFITDEQGQSTTEYILILAVVVMIAMKFKKEFGTKMTDLVGHLTDGINTQVEDSLNGSP